MKKTIKLALVAALALGTSSAYATNGDTMIGQGAKSRAMGAVGIAKSFGAESALANPALLNSVKNKEFTGGITFFMPDVVAGSNAGSRAQSPTAPISTSTSDADFSAIPEMYYASRINDSVVYGIAIAGTAGMGVDYDSVPFGVAGDNGLFQMKTALQLLKVAVPLSITEGDLTVGISPILLYGTLEMSHMRQTSGPGVPPTFAKLQSPEASDTSLGFELGFTYSLSDSLELGGIYKSKLSMTYDNTISGSIAAFGGAAQTGVNSGDNLDQPAEYGLGLSYVSGANTIAFDYKNIAWSSAAGYKDFGWEDQDVIAIGYEYATNEWAFRLGYNHASSPIKEQDGNPLTAGNAAYGNAVKNFFNLAGFPGMVETHYTIGAGYTISESLTFDAAIVYAAESTNSFDTTGMTAAFQANGTNPPNPANWTGDTSSADVSHSQMGVTLAMTYNF